MLIRVCAESIAFLPPLCLSSLVQWLQATAGTPSVSAPSSSTAFFDLFARTFGRSSPGCGVALAACMLAAGIANPILIQWHHYMITRIGFHMRTALTCVCHAHLLRASGDALQGMGLGTARCFQTTILCNWLRGTGERLSQASRARIRTGLNLQKSRM